MSQGEVVPPEDANALCCHQQTLRGPPPFASAVTGEAGGRQVGGQVGFAVGECLQRSSLSNLCCFAVDSKP